MFICFLFSPPLRALDPVNRNCNCILYFDFLFVSLHMKLSSKNFLICLFSYCICCGVFPSSKLVIIGAFILLLLLNHASQERPTHHWRIHGFPCRHHGQASCCLYILRHITGYHLQTTSDHHKPPHPIPHHHHYYPFAPPKLLYHCSMVFFL